MNCIILLLLLGCCGGWGNESGCSDNCGCCGRSDKRERSDCARKRPEPCDRRPEPCGCDGRREEPCDRGRERSCPGPERCNTERESNCCDRRPDPCDCERERPCREPEPCGCAREERDCDAPSSGLIPPPWQDYPRFPRRDNGDGCES